MTFRELTKSIWEGFKNGSALLFMVILPAALMDGKPEVAAKVAGTIAVFCIFQVFADWKLERAKRWIASLENKTD